MPSLRLRVVVTRWRMTGKRTLRNGPVADLTVARSANQGRLERDQGALVVDLELDLRPGLELPERNAVTTLIEQLGVRPDRVALAGDGELRRIEGVDRAHLRRRIERRRDDDEPQ